MRTIEHEGIAAGKGAAIPRNEDDTALHGAENEGVPLSVARSPAAGSRTHAFARMSAYLRREDGPLRKGQDLTREQLLAALGKATDGNRLLTQQSAPLMVLIASDIERTRRFPLPVDLAAAAWPLHTWRERYNGLDRFLPGLS